MIYYSNLNKNTTPTSETTNKGTIYTIQNKLYEMKCEIAHEVYMVFIFYFLTYNKFLYLAWWWPIKTETCTCSSLLHNKCTAFSQDINIFIYVYFVMTISKYNDI